jgi:sporulation protein YlmC with PRC-barrel domain
MPTATGHTTAITASRVIDATVYNAAGEEIGHVEDLVLDKTSDRIKFAVLGFGGFLGIGERYHALPWAALNYSEEQGGYVVNISRADLEKAPSYELNDLTRSDGAAQAPALEYYSRFVGH